MTSNVSGPPRRQVVAALGAAMAASAAPASAQALPDKGPWTGGGLVKRAGGQIHYATLGEGEPLVLLHKLGGSVDDWAACAPLLAAAGRKVIAIDLPGHGESAMLGTPPRIQTVPETTAMIKAALEEIGVTRFAIGGNSLGGICGIVMAACWPGAVTKLALVSVSMIGAMTPAQVEQLDRDARSSFGPNWEPLPLTPKDIAIVGIKDPQVLRADNASRAKAGVWLRPQERGVAIVGVTDYLPRVRAPSLVVQTDSGRYAKYGAVAKATMPDVTVVVIPGGGSFLHQEKPVETAAAMNAFLGA
jgi:pimeloyl-ACP methyl ester carboxylesterase